MLLIALMTLAVTVQDPAGSAVAERYVPPAVRPFEPPSSFGRTPAQGDADAGLHRRPLTVPVVVEAYRRSYEAGPTDAEIAYEQGVHQARLDQDARMGPLDGRWRVTGADGRTLLDLVLSDRGPGKPVEGAWSRRTVEAAAQAVANDMGVVEAVVRDGTTAVIEATVGGRPVRLRLHPTPTGWSGGLSGPDGDQPVTLTRPS